MRLTSLIVFGALTGLSVPVHAGSNESVDDICDHDRDCELFRPRDRRGTGIALAVQGGLFDLWAWIPTLQGSTRDSTLTAEVSLAVDVTWGIGKTRRTKLGLRAVGFCVPELFPDEPDDPDDRALGFSVAGAGVGLLLSRWWLQLSPGIRVNYLWGRGSDGAGLTIPEFHLGVGLEIPIYGRLAVRITGEIGFWLPLTDRAFDGFLGRHSLTGGAVVRL